MSFDTVVAYTFKADIYCPACIVRSFKNVAPDHVVDDLNYAEEILAAAATIIGLDRLDEHTFDSDDFPKACFRHHFEDKRYEAESNPDDDGITHCGGCDAIVDE